MFISNFFEVRDRLFGVLVNSSFVLIVRHCYYPPRLATKPRWDPTLQVVLEEVIIELTECQ
jgi:hypothetical protein